MKHIHIKKVIQKDYPDNGLKALKLTGPGQDIGTLAGTNCQDGMITVINYVLWFWDCYGRLGRVAGGPVEDVGGGRVVRNHWM